MLFFLLLRNKALKTYPEMFDMRRLRALKVGVWKKKTKLFWMLVWIAFHLWDNSHSFLTFLAVVWICLFWIPNLYFVKFKLIFSHYLCDRQLLGVKTDKREWDKWLIVGWALGCWLGASIFLRLPAHSILDSCSESDLRELSSCCPRCFQMRSVWATVFHFLVG